VPGFYPDPSVCRVGRDYYLVSSSFEYFPGVPIFQSRDLVHWRQIGHCLDRPSQLPLTGARASGGIYAPTLRYWQGTFYLTTTNTSHGNNFIVTATSPAGPWSDPLWVEQEGIDPSLCFDDDGSAYYTSAHGGALQSTIDARTGKLLSEPKIVWRGTGAQYPEAPHLYRRGDWYYLLLAEGGTEYGHMVTMARSRSAWGPFEPCARNPLLTHRSYKSPVQMTGHADLIEAHDGSHWAVFLATRPNGYPPCYHLGRETFLSPVVWADDGFPIIGEGGRVSLEMDGPPWQEPVPKPPSRDDFDREELANHWNFLRNPDPDSFSLLERPGWLRLRGSHISLDDVASPAWLGRRQCHFALEALVRVQFRPGSENEEAGLVVRMNETHHYELFVTRRGGQPSVVLRRRIGSLRAELACQPLGAGEASDLILAVLADRTTYRFSFGPDEGALQLLGQGETRYLSTEVAGGFTGVYLAMYASGNGRPCMEPADFDWFEYRELEDKP
ncbi:MAG TPA: glycoside hydrolase family 43 protein, partial [Polyangiaceae bacterium]|nr:glycoside hydrolase family 43 protein [Polyangiaceae bacterium]